MITALRTVLLFSSTINSKVLFEIYSCPMKMHHLQKIKTKLLVILYFETGIFVKIMKYYCIYDRFKYSQMKTPEGIEDKHYDNFSLL